MKKYNLAVVGANGAVGEEVLRILEEIDFPLAKLVPLASSRSAGKTVEFNGNDVVIKELTNEIFEQEEIEIAIFSAGGSVSEAYAPAAVKAGAVVIDNTSHFRMDPNVPLVVPEVNPEDIAKWEKTGIIANPNCSTIQMVQALKPLDEAYDLVRVDVATYQATSGAGKSAMEELVTQMQDFFAFKLDESEHKAFNQQIALNVIPQIDKFMDNGYTKEEMTGHGFRSMASTILNEQGWHRDAIERQLAHAERNTVRAAYNYAEHLSERVKMMQAWADYLDGLKKGADVVPIHKTN
ncbi:MAG: aspartate-semialdehyde dehydrogenase [Sulfurimonas sp.]